MNIEGIKERLDIENLKLVRNIDITTGEPTEWLSNWNYEERIRISVHQDVAKVASKSNKLFLKPAETKISASGKEYTSIILCESTSEEAKSEMTL